MRLSSLIVFGSLLAFGCGPGDRAPHLIELSEVSPRHLEVGDRMRLSGSGFPEGRPATVTLRGEVRRGGDLPRTNVSVSADAEMTAPHALELPIHADFANKLCGGPSARHCTFRGDVEASFSPQTASGLPVVGRLDGVVLDFVPAARDDAAQSALRVDGARFARFLGVTLGASPEGVQLSAVEPGGRGARANLSVGDVVRELDGVVVRGLSDFIPPPNAKSSQLLVRRGPDSLALRVDAGGFRYSAPETLLPVLTLFGCLFTVFLAVASPLGRWLALFERRLAERLKEARPTPAVLKRDWPLWRAAKSLFTQQLPESFLPYLAVVAASALFSLLSLSKSVIWDELDVLLLPAASFSALFASAFIAGGAERWTLRSGLSRAFTVLLFNLPLIGWIVATALWAGSLRAADVVGLQGPWPWQWTVFRNPLLGLLAATTLLSRIATVHVEASPNRRGGVSARQRALSLAAWTHTLCITGLIALLGLGGGALPTSRATTFMLAAGVVLTLGKASFLVSLIALWRWTFGATDIVAARRAALLWLVLPSGVALAIAAVFAGIGFGPTLGTLAQALPPIAFGSSLAVLGWFGWRLLRGTRGPSAALRIQSWL